MCEFNCFKKEIIFMLIAGYLHYEPCFESLYINSSFYFSLDPF